MKSIHAGAMTPGMRENVEQCVDRYRSRNLGQAAVVRDLVACGTTREQAEEHLELIVSTDL